MNKNNKNIKGAGGGDSSSHTASNSPVTLSTKSTERVLFLLGQGENKGLADQVSPLKSTYFGNTPVMNADGTLNYNNVVVEERFGLPSQTTINGFSTLGSPYNLGSKVTTASPVTYTSTTTNVDSIRVTINIPALYEQLDNGDTTGTTVQFRISTKLGTGSYTTYSTPTKTDRANSPVAIDYLVNRPGTTGVWSVRVERVTADNSVLTKQNNIYFQTATEIRNRNESYPGMGLIGLTVSSADTGTTYPVVSFDYYGRLIKVPSNYTVATRTYSGVWDGLFKSTKEWCDNPAYVLYDMLTAGLTIDTAYIDQYSVYNAGVYSDALVPNGFDGTEPRYTFNYDYMVQGSAWDMVQGMAAAMGCSVYTSGQYVKVVQDRPATAGRLITNSTVIDGLFNYTYPQKEDRTTACTVYWNDPLQNGLSVPAYYEDTAKISSAGYGYNFKEITGIGITSEGQAFRLAKWTVDTSVNAAKVVGFTVGYMNAGMEPGEVIKIMDTAYSATEQEARLVSATSTTMTFDRPVNVASGNTVDVMLPDGTGVQTRTITSSGLVSNINFTGGAIAASSNVTVVITGSISPQQYRISSVSEKMLGGYEITATQYELSKYGRVDGTFTLTTPQYQNRDTVPPVTAINFTEKSYIDANGSAIRSLVASWTPPLNAIVSSYEVLISKEGGSIGKGTGIVQPSYSFNVDRDGIYTVTIYAINALGTSSPGASADYTVNLSAPAGTSASLPVNTLQVKGGGTTFIGTDLNVTWIDPNINAASVVAGYEVQVKDAATPTTVYRTELVTVPEYTYDLTKQQTDNGSNLKRSVIIQVRVKDTWGRFSSALAVTFTNPPPAAVTGVVVTASFKAIDLKWAIVDEADVLGYLVWRGTTVGFTPSAGNLIFDGNANSTSDGGLSDSATYYYKFAAYDVFGKSYSGTGLTLGSASSATTLAGVNVNEYRLTGVTWTPNSPATNQVAWSACTAIQTLGSGSGATWSVVAGNATWTSGILYIYYTSGGTTLQSSNVLSNAIADTKIIVATYRGGSNLEIGDGKAYTDGSFIIAGTVAAAQLVTGTAVITQGAQIGDTIITPTKLQTGIMQADNVLTRGLTVRDALGNIIVAAGTAVNWAKLGGASGNLTGLGYTGALNATANQTDTITNNAINTAGTTANWTSVSSRPTTLSGLNSTEGTKLAGIEAGATVGMTSTQLTDINAAFVGKLQKSGDSITGRISMTVADGIFAGSDINNGVYFGNGGLVGKKAGNTTFAIGTDGSAIFSGKLTASEFMTGGYTGFAWPAAGQTGSYLSSQGLLLGNLNTGGTAGYFGVTATGDLYMPGMSIVNRVMTIDAINVIGTVSIKGNAVTVPVSAYIGGSITYSWGGGTEIISAAITSPGGMPIYVAFSFSFDGGTLWRTGIYRNGTFLAFVGAASGGYTDTPGAGTWTYQIRPDSNPIDTYSGVASSRSLFLLGTKR